MKWSKRGQEHVLDLERILSILLCLEEQDATQNQACSFDIASSVEEDRMRRNMHCLELLRAVSRAARKVFGFAKEPLKATVDHPDGMPGLPGFMKTLSGILSPDVMLVVHQNMRGRLRALAQKLRIQARVCPGGRSTVDASSGAHSFERPNPDPDPDPNSNLNPDPNPDLNPNSNPKP
jgi:hypothetical protein